MGSGHVCVEKQTFVGYTMTTVLNKEE